MKNRIRVIPPFNKSFSLLYSKGYNGYGMISRCSDYKTDRNELASSHYLDGFLMNQDFKLAFSCQATRLFHVDFEYMLSCFPSTLILLALILFIAAIAG